MDFVSFRPRWLAFLFNQATVGRYYPESRHPVSRVLFRVYEPVCRAVLRNPLVTVLIAVLIMATTIPVYRRLGQEFMPSLNEGSILYMPITLPGISVGEASRLLQAQDRLLKSFPEVEHVHGKAGRAETATDPAPLSMMETIVTFKPRSFWRPRARWYSDHVPGWMQPPLRYFWPDRISWDELIEEMDARLRIPGTTNAWPMPIKNRIDMLTTGMRTAIGVKVYGPDLKEIERIGEQLELVLRGVPGTRSVFAERVAGGYFVDFDLKRDALARHGLSVATVQDVIMSAVGGENVTTAVEGRVRVPVNVRYPRELRDDLQALGDVLVMTPAGASVPLSQVADLRKVEGPSMIRDENGFLAGYVYVDPSTSDIGGYVERAKKTVAAAVSIPSGYSLEWSGQWENIVRVRQRLLVVVPLTIVLIFFLLYMNMKSAIKAAFVLLAVPFSVVGAVWLMYALGYNVSIAAWVGMIALMGLDAETGVFMLLFLDLSLNEAQAAGRLRSDAELQEAIVHGAVKRVRPKIMTVAAAFMGLMPILWSTGTGADMMKRVAAPMVGGLVTSFLLELAVYPALYLLWKRRSLVRVERSAEMR
jgi:copper/silver efflux system protein